MVEEHQDEVDNRLYHSCDPGYHHWCDRGHEQEEELRMCRDDVILTIATLLFDSELCSS